MRNLHLRMNTFLLFLIFSVNITFAYLCPVSCIIISRNSPIVCAVLALDSWNYCSGEQAQQPNICKIVQSSLSSWTMYIITENKVLQLYVNSLTTRWHMLGIPLPLNQWSHAWQILRRRCWTVRPALQSSSSNCLVLIPHRQLGNYLLGTRESYDPTAQHMQDWS